VTDIKGNPLLWSKSAEIPPERRRKGIAGKNSVQVKLIIIKGRR